VRQAIAKAFPVATELFRLAGEEPRTLLGDTWETMLEVRSVYEDELKACRATFDKIEWRSGIFEDAAFVCSECQSELIAQNDPGNTDSQSAESHCRSCGAKISAEALIENAIAAHLDWESYVAMTDGGDAPLGLCERKLILGASGINQ
jgi:DNA-directed RNA polymerase subunit RPC12/RpoP